ncbi:MAG: gamma-butyrobetaine dioxygenase [Gammaproteobacteria bacterium]|nr:gamma-butyrobetaine dioxygenase [Gammaproteobacteria bacterium]
MNTIKSFSFKTDQLTIEWQDGRQSQLAAIWLRDHCQMPECRDPHSGQRLLNITDIPADTRIQSVEQIDDKLVVVFAPENHVSEFSTNWLLDNCYCLNKQSDDRSEQGKKLWQTNSFANGLPRFDYASFCQSGITRATALQAVKDYGFVLLDGVPCEDGYILQVIGKFGYVRETNYGPLFNVRTEVNANNLAFTNLGLGCHLDNPYRDPVPGIQLLHCLESSTTGGESILQDGFMAANVLRDENPEHFKTLSRQWINYRFQDSCTDLHSRVAMFEVNDLNQVIKVRYNNRSIDTLRLERSQIKPFYAAYRHYAEIIEREELQISFKLGAGELMMFDNTRVLHARKSYSDGGIRHLQGAYSDLDGLYSTLSMLQAENHNDL